MKAVLVLALASVALADQPAPYSPPAPSYNPSPYKEPTYADVPPKYQYQYAVKDDYSNVDFDANEARDGYATNGGYRVALPDGRIQTVTYTVTDGYSGYVAEVSYEGEPQYPVYEPKPYKPSPPAYKPAPPAYKPAPPAYPSF